VASVAGGIRRLAWVDVGVSDGRWLAGLASRSLWEGDDVLLADVTLRSNSWCSVRALGDGDWRGSWATDVAGRGDDVPSVGNSWLGAWATVRAVLSNGVGNWDETGGAQGLDGGGVHTDADTNADIDTIGSSGHNGRCRRRSCHSGSGWHGCGRQCSWSDHEGAAGSDSGLSRYRGSSNKEGRSGGSHANHCDVLEAVSLVNVLFFLRRKVPNG
jgi:hypothetical protein